MQCFVGDEECFEVDSLFDRQPVEVLEEWGDVLSLRKESLDIVARISPDMSHK